MINKYRFLCFVYIFFSSSNGFADNSHFAFMSASDLGLPDTSNISIKNNTSQSVPAYGLYITSIDINDCSSCYGAIVGGDNLGGAVVSKTMIQANQSVPIGKNFLYNMIYNGLYYAKNVSGSSLCSLPGCSWPGDNPSVHGWCLSINVISRHSNYTYSHYTNGSNPPANAPAYGYQGNNPAFDYKYALINPITLGVGGVCLGPVVCNDKTLTCSVSSAQTQSFQAY